MAQTRLQQRMQSEALDRQEAHQARLEGQRLEAERRRWQTDTRREAYSVVVVALEKFSTFGRTFEELSASVVDGRPLPVDPDPQAVVDQCRQRYVEAFDLTQLMRLTGQEEVVTQAHRTVDAMWRYFDMCERLVMRSAEGQGRTDEEHQEFREVFRQFRTELRQFVQVAAADLQQEPFPP